MTTLHHAIAVARRTPPREFAVKVARRARSAAARRARYEADRRRSTYSPFARGSIARRIGTVDPGAVGDLTTLADAAARYLEHRYDVLGSGWVDVGRGAACRGFGGVRFPPGERPVEDPAGRWLAGVVPDACVPDARTRWRLVGDGYRSIDWQLDVRSGYRWSERAWSPHIRYGDQRGVDVKVPWELARAQHLPQLALASIAARGGRGFLAPERYVDEIRNQILDFLATNPPRFGVNWSCAMDVAIRAANWVVAADLACAGGATFDAGFHAALVAGLRDHGRHIVEFVEWSPVVRANHYLADLAGLAFVAAYLPEDDETDRWLGFAARELLLEGRHQFLPDGGNFEASTSYHRLSTELLLYATAVLAGVDDDRMARTWALQWSPPPVPSRAVDRDHRGALAELAAVCDAAVRFWERTVRPDGHVPQVGDNDSGRFFKLTPAWALVDGDEASAIFEQPPVAPGPYLFEDPLDHAHLAAAVDGLRGRVPRGRHRLEGLVVAALARDTLRGAGEHRGAANRSRAARIPEDCQEPSRPPSRSVRVRLGDGRGAGVGLEAFPDFGLFVYRGPSLYLAIRCGPLGQDGAGGHAHLDQLAFELVVDGADWVADPGTWTYTPLPDERDAYRSSRAHAGLLRDDPPGAFANGLFTLVAAAGRPVSASDDHFVGELDASGLVLRRSFTITDSELEIADWGAPDDERREATASGPDELRALFGLDLPYSPGYGIRLRPDARSWWRARIRAGAQDGPPGGQRPSSSP